MFHIFKCLCLDDVSYVIRNICKLLIDWASMDTNVCGAIMTLLSKSDFDVALCGVALRSNESCSPPQQELPSPFPRNLVHHGISAIFKVSNCSNLVMVHHNWCPEGWKIHYVTAHNSPRLPVRLITCITNDKIISNRYSKSFNIFSPPMIIYIFFFFSSIKAARKLPWIASFHIPRIAGTAWCLSRDWMTALINSLKCHLW